MAKTSREIATYWTTPLLPHGELVTATFHEQRFCRHWHEAFVVAVVLDGVQGYWYRGAQRTSATGMFDVINPGEVHTGEPATASGWTYRAFYPPVEWIHHLTRTLTEAPATAPWFPDDPIADPTGARQLVAAHVLLETGVDAIQADTSLYRAFASLLSRHAKNRPRLKCVAPDAARVHRMQQRLGDDLAESITLRALAASVGLSPFHAARLLTRTTGMPPHAWRNQLRVHRAVELLRSGTAVADAAAAVGFFDQSHLARYFKRAYGVPPSALAKALRS
jgi:AraC-like DNA-binding protein